MELFDKIIDRSNTYSIKWEKYKSSDILPMWVADMDFKSPQPIIDALQKRVSHGIFGYTIMDQDTINSVKNFIKNNYNWDIKSEWIVWNGCGVVSSMNVVSKITKGDDILINTPIYPHFKKAPQNASKNIVEVPMVEKENRWTIDFNMFEKKITKECKLFMFCNPYNPGGTVFRRDELEKLSKICLKYDITICSDEIHADLILNPNASHIPIASLSEQIANKTITLLAPSKTFNIAGLQSSLAIIPNRDLRREFQKEMKDICCGVNLLAIEATRVAYESCEEWLEKLRLYLKENLELVQNFVNQNKSLKLLNQDATFLAWIDVSKLKLNDPYEYFLNYGVGLSSGEPFGDKNFLRLNFGTQRSRLKEALKRMENAIDAREKELS